MVNFKFGNEMWKVNWSTWHEHGTKKKSESPTGIEPITCGAHFITELKIHHLYSLITTPDDFDSADPSSMQEACHIWTQLNDLALHESLQLSG